MTWNDGDFDSPDPFVRYAAHQAAKGNVSTLSPDVWDSRDKTASDDGEAVDGDA